MSSNAKGQFFSYDAIIAAAIFLIAISLLLSYWQGAKRTARPGLLGDAMLVSETLLSQNYLAGKPGSGAIPIENFTALRGISESDYWGLKEKLRVDGEFWVGVSGTGISCNGTCSFGKEPPAEAEQSYATRLVLIDGKPAVFRVVIWREE